MITNGSVYIVGAGPGAPDLLTLRAARLLARATIVFHDALVHPDTLALAINAEHVHVGKRCGRHSTAQHFINKRLIDAARAGHIVVRLKGGDPMIFGRSQEELDALAAAGITAEVVPGVTAALAAAAELRTSLTRRGSSRSVAFATPSTGEAEPTTDWAQALTHADSAAIYMGTKQAETVKARLLGIGRSARTPVIVCESVSLPTARSVSGTLRDLPALCAGLGEGPKLILVGSVFAQARDCCLTRLNSADTQSAA